ncbi:MULTISPECIES: hypothetical protein [unclassified Streptomyces]|uniref:hypothetical protein n=1 Tax=unclassified Streptomyces TaxID=2593676 RepID=UPI001BEB2E2A|nr:MULTISPECIES: hypothetical protein [unclassified Streptomyces]MBT2404928.1 hypothetical protein [Streptomyces sp. ISL-21]MBT2455954.1 hypothetical protein [Streptomyces sp. ISL-86]MBT2611343.1 hypothetical protein [Streptomyces sp. ISL-87]
MLFHLPTALRRRLVLPLATAVVASLVAVGPASAEAQAPAGVSVTGSTVQLNWTAIPDASAYLIVDDRIQRVLWRGTQTSAELPAHAPESFALVVVALTDNGSEPVAKALATVPDAASGLTPLTAVTTASGTTLGWGPIPDVTTYDVTSEGHTLAHTAAVQVQTPATLGEQAKYEMHAMPAITSEVTPATVTDVSYGVELTPPATATDKAPADAQPGDTLPANVRVLTYSRNVYETYIPMAFVDAPEHGSWIDCDSGDGDSDYWFAGDNRGVGYETGKYRSKAVAKYDWTSAFTFTSASVSATHRYKKLSNGTFAFDSERKAGEDGVDIRPLQNDGRYGRTVIDHEVHNPYCSPVAGITYTNQQDVYQNGSHWIYGNHDKMPNHQFYRYDQYSDGTYALDLVFNHPLDSPSCLAGWMGGCSAWQYQYTR